jgi:hypothetical protein
LDFVDKLKKKHQNLNHEVKVNCQQQQQQQQHITRRRRRRRRRRGAGACWDLSPFLGFGAIPLTQILSCLLLHIEEVYI